MWGVLTYELSANPPARIWSAHLLNYSVDGRVFFYVLVISLCGALLFGLAPLPYLSKLDVNGALKDGGRGSTAGRRGQQLSGILIVGEMAPAVVLLARCRRDGPQFPEYGDGQSGCSYAWYHLNVLELASRSLSGPCGPDFFLCAAEDSS
jgi:hypothetical protein